MGCHEGRQIETCGLLAHVDDEHLVGFERAIGGIVVEHQFVEQLGAILGVARGLVNDGEVMLANEEEVVRAIVDAQILSALEDDLVAADGALDVGARNKKVDVVAHEGALHLVGR